MTATAKPYNAHAERFVNVALRGTQRTTHDDAAQVLLQFGLQAMRKRGGYIPHITGNDLPNPAPQPALACNERTVQHIQFISQKMNQPYYAVKDILQEELLNLLDATQQGLSAEWQPAALMAGMTNKTDRTAMLTERGRWLARESKLRGWRWAWQEASDKEQSSSIFWQKGLQRLRRIRHDAPHMAYNLLNTYIQLTDYEHRQLDLMAILHINLSQDDEAHLIQLAQHPSEDVQRGALELLMYIAGNGFGQRVRKLMLPALHIEQMGYAKKWVLGFTWSRGFQHAPDATGFDKRQKALKLDHLLPEELASLIPPRELCDHWGLPPEALVEGARNGLIMGNLLGTWQRYALSGKDVAFTRALIDRATSEQINRRELIATLSTRQRMSHSTHLLAQNALWRNDHPACLYLDHIDAMWSQALSNSFLKALDAGLTKTRSVDYRALMTYLCRMHPNSITPTLAMLKRKRDSYLPTERGSHRLKAIYDYTAILRFRQMMHSAILNEGANNHD